MSRWSQSKSCGLVFFIGLVFLLQLSGTIAATPAGAAEGWQQAWEKTKAAAAKEGRLVLYSSAGSAVRTPLTAYFSKNFNINLEWVAARNAELSERVSREHRAGIYAGDIYFSGTSAITEIGDTVLEPLDPLLILPEVTDKKAWEGGDLPAIDEKRTWVGLLAFPQPPILINTNMVKPGEVKSYKDLLHPKWKKEIVMYVPTTGAGLAWAYNVGEVIMSRDYLRAFAKQEPIILDNSRQQCEWVARGKHPIAIGARSENQTEFINLKAPVQLISPIEGVHLTSSAGGVGIFRKAPHPNASKLFMNWALSKEGGTLISKAVGGQSARVDVPTDFLDPNMVRQPGIKYFNTMSMKHIEKKQAFVPIAKEIFGSLMQ